MGVRLLAPAEDMADFAALVATDLGPGVPFVGRVPGGLAGPLRRALEGDATGGLPIDWGRRTSFEVAALRATMTIPAGEVRPYAWIAREAGRPRAVRAAGSTMAGNTLAIIVPCHRVVRSDGHAGPYGPGGAALKRSLLRAEGVDLDALEALADRGVRYLGALPSWRFCFPTCGALAAVDPADRVPLRNGPLALDAGFAPCPVCRPLLGSPFR